jgi:hypothetical protein
MLVEVLQEKWADLSQTVTKLEKIEEDLRRS